MNKVEVQRELEVKNLFFPANATKKVMQEILKQHANEKASDNGSGVVPKDAFAGIHVPVPTPEVVVEPEAVTSDCAGFEYGGANLDDPTCEDCKAESQAVYEACAAKAQAVVKPAKRTTNGLGRKPSAQKQFVADMLAAGQYTRKQIIDGFLLQFPDAAKSTVTTYLSDSKNPKYNKFPFLVKVREGSQAMYYDVPA